MRLWYAAQHRRYELLISPATVSEISRKLRRKFYWEDARALRQTKLMARTRTLVVPRFVLHVMEDESDNQ